MNIKQNKDLIRSNVDALILRPLLERDCYGYEILSSIQENSNGLYAVKQPTLYSCLKRLENQGKIESYLGDVSQGAQRRYYTLTDLGKKYINQYCYEWEYVRTILNGLISDKEFDPDLEIELFDASELRPKTKRTRRSDVDKDGEKEVIIKEVIKEVPVIKEVIKEVPVHVAATTVQQPTTPQPKVEEVEKPVMPAAEKEVEKDTRYSKDTIIQTSDNTEVQTKSVKYDYHKGTISMTEDEINKFYMNNYLPKELREESARKRKDEGPTAEERQEHQSKNQAAYYNYVSELSQENAKKGNQSYSILDEDLDRINKNAEKQKELSPEEILFLDKK